MQRRYRQQWEGLDESQPAATSAKQSGRMGDWLSGWRGLAIGLGVGAALATAGTHLLAGAPTTAPAPKPSTVAAGQSVTLAPATMTGVAQTVDATGSVAAFDMLPILAQATGLQIQQVLVEEGQSVTAGQVLAVLDNAVLNAQRNQAQADVASTQAIVRQKQATLGQERATLAQAESNLRRYQDLARSGAVSQQNLDTYVTAAKTAREAIGVAQATITSAQADVQSKIAEVQRLETQIAQTVVRAPANGVIAEKVARVGNVTATEKLFFLIRDGSLELQAKVPETELPQVKIGAIARITSDADKRIRLQGRVREISPLVDPQSRQATVKIDLPTSALLRSGMFLKAAVTVQTAQALTIPASAVLPQPDGRSLVYVLEGTDSVRAKPVVVGTRQDSTDPTKARIAIKSGLNAGDRVVVAGAGYVKDGERVTVVSQ
ncbi:MAG: efflux RND transporter periplasmic adaptor subunit [Verrucomicrobia bacterium]|nr:efflux RND transporter periplasmic adaptor subunit [Leptolyngbya sp. ES-bin-22]